MTPKIKLHLGDTMLIMAKDGEIIHFTPGAVQEIPWPFGTRIFGFWRGFDEGAGLKTL